MKKRVLSIVLAVLMMIGACVAAVSCAQNNEGTQKGKVKLGVILLHDELSTYDNNFIVAVKEAAAQLGLEDSQVIIKKNVAESNACYEAAVELVAAGCNVIFADSFGHESYMINAAKEFPNVEFCHATGTNAHTAGLKNFHNAFASIYEGRYLAGVVAGLKLKEMDAEGKITDQNKDENGKVKIGYVGAFTYAEVISGYTSFYLGVKSQYENVSMMVQFTGSWYDENKERTAAQTLISRGCALISQHADSMGAPAVCEDMKVPNVAYNGSTVDSCPDTFLVASRINWAPYFKYICEQMKEGKPIADDFAGTLTDGSVVLSEINEKAAAKDTAAVLESVKNELIAGTRKVFDTAAFTKGGEVLTSYMADVDYDENHTPDTEAIKDGFFHESEYRSAPYFDIRIDDIVLLNEEY